MQRLNPVQNTAILDEILIKPANVIKHDRFSAQSTAANCNGICSSGACRAIAS